MSLPRTLRPDRDVVDTELDDGELALLHLGTRTYFTLNATGARIWRGLQEGRTLEDVSRQLQEEFAVDAEQAERSIGRLAEELVLHKLAAPR